jgi:hypothetical protein
MFFSKLQNGAIDLLEVGGAAGQPGALLDRNSTSDADGAHHRKARDQDEQVYKRKAGRAPGMRCR